MQCTSSLHWWTKNHKSDFLVIIVITWYLLHFTNRWTTNHGKYYYRTATYKYTYAKLKVNFAATVVPFIANTILTQCKSRRCWTRSEEHHGEKIENGSFASDLRFVHISRYAIKIPGEIVWYGHYRSSSAFKGHNMRFSFEIFVRKGGRSRRLLLASQNCYFLCRRD